MSERARVDEPGVPAPSSHRTTETRLGWRWSALFASAGGIALGVQVYLLREYLVVLGGDESALGLGLGAWLVGISLGALFARSIEAAPDRQAAAALLGLALSGWCEMLVARWGRILVGAPAGELLALGPSLLLAVMVFLLPGAMVGTGFVALAARAATGGVAVRAMGFLYVWEALGSLGLGLLVSWVLMANLASLTGLALLAAIGLALALPAAQARVVAGKWWIAGLAAAGVATPFVVRPLEEASQRARFGSFVAGVPLVDWDDTPYQHADIGGGDARVLYLDGQYATSFPDPTEDETRAHQWMLLAAQPARVLALGGLETGALRFCLAHPVRELELVVLDRRVFELTRRHLAPEDERALADPRVKLRFDDPRRYLGQAGAPYDLVLLLGPDPVTLFHARMTTVEFHRLVAARLAPNGVYVTRFSAGANVQTGQTGKFGGAVVRSLREVFGAVRAVPEPDGLLVASRSAEAVTLDPEPLARRYRERGIRSEVFAPELLPMLMPPERVASLEQELFQAAAGAAPTTDDHPVALLAALSVRQEKAKSAWGPLLGWAATHPDQLLLTALLPSLLCAVLGMARRRSLRPALHATVTTGACGMAWSLMLFFSFQTRVGALYSELGALSALFMLGLAAGGFWATGRARRSGFLLAAQALSLLAAALLTGAFAVLPELRWGRWLLIILHAAMLFAAGAGTGVVFPSAVAALVEQGRAPRRAASLVELSDHAGAAAAAVFAAVLFIPALGLTRTALLLLVLQAITLGESAWQSRRTQGG